MYSRLADRDLPSASSNAKGKSVSTVAILIFLGGIGLFLLGFTQVEAPRWKRQGGTAGEILSRHMAATLERMSELHRIVDQATKASIYLDRFIRMGRPPLAPAQSPTPATPPLSN